jgi:threonine/homoserine/homoserine lactone efflux protein
VLTYLILGAGIGFVAGVSPGPVLTLVVAESLKAGWGRGSAVAAGPLLADGPIIVVALLVLGQLPPEAVRALSLGGGLFLVYLSATTAWQSRRAMLPRNEPSRVRLALLTGLLTRALSPNPYVFWMLVGAPILVQADPWSKAAFLVGYYATIVGSNVGLALALHAYTARLSATAYRWLLRLSAVILAAYGIVLFERARR